MGRETLIFSAHTPVCGEMDVCPRAGESPLHLHGEGEQDAEAGAVSPACHWRLSSCPIHARTGFGTFQPGLTWGSPTIWSSSARQTPWQLSVRRQGSRRFLAERASERQPRRAGGGVRAFVTAVRGFRGKLDQNSCRDQGVVEMWFLVMTRVLGFLPLSRSGHSAALQLRHAPRLGGLSWVAGVPSTLFLLATAPLGCYYNIPSGLP